MLNSLFLTVNQWIVNGSMIGAVGSFTWGMTSVLFSPCHIASIPLIVAYIGGQRKTLDTRQAGVYSALFTAGLFTTITLVGIVCSLLGRMLGDVGNYWQIIIGVILIWVSLGILGVERCSVSGNMLTRINLKGYSGAFLLGLAYGILSGTCTFGFIAPILAIITIQKQVGTGILYILLFAIGHCLPILIAGSSAALVQGLIENRAWQRGGIWFRKGAGILICVLGIYFIVSPFYI
ncbi:sulfite exporter TauE/SafE family protein [bacterium]|nr:sulfite exporter TauE/SafE family protein [bacterium]